MPHKVGPCIPRLKDGGFTGRRHKAINSGVNLDAMSANSLYWQIRYQSSAYSGSNRIIVCYKDASLDPLSTKIPALTTVQFRNAPVSKPEQTLLGQMYVSYLQGTGYPWVVSDASSWVFGGTNVQNGDSLPGLVGYEFDQTFPQSPQPFSET
ncbi:MAG TPA: N,N-dimethylformamidase beta subunit family domain-containing protein [Ktedonobacteraceae bacterium]|nr:N,N-dimethylformamidase beta subunit family domain-containing protein [Ktedonobacteraceae bacterium]